jgi:hypothetical protein
MTSPDAMAQVLGLNGDPGGAVTSPGCRKSSPSKRPTDISGQLVAVRGAYRKWLGESYDLGALNCVLAAAASEKLGGDPPWLLVIGGSGAAKTETLMALSGAGASIVSTITGEAALLSGTPEKDRAKDATGGLLFEIKASGSGLLVIKDVTSILSMNRDTRALVLAALREIHDGSWSRKVGADGGRTLEWSGRIVVIGACTTAWDAAHQVIATMGDRFLLVRLAADAEGRRSAGLKAIRNVGSELAMRDELQATVGKLLGQVSAAPSLKLTDDETGSIFDLADLVTRARTAVERDFKGNPLFAHALEMPTRLAKQLVQLGRGGLALGMTRKEAMAVVERSAADTMPPLRLRVLAYVAEHPNSATADVVKGLQLPRATVDRLLQELHLLELLVVDEIAWGQSVRWIYSLADDVSTTALKKLTGNVTTP